MHAVLYKIESIKTINILTRVVLNTRASSQTDLNSDSSVLQELLHHWEGKEGQQCNYTKHTQQVCGTQFKLPGLLKGKFSEWHRKTLWSPRVCLRLHLFDLQAVRRNEFL